MTMKELHLKVIEMMQRVRSSVPDFHYGTRQRNAVRGREDRIADGAIFLGTENYILVPFSPILSMNMTSCLSCVFNVENGSIVRAHIEIVVPSNCSSEFKKVQCELKECAAKLLKINPRLDATTRRYDRYSVLIAQGGNDAVLSSVEVFLKKGLSEMLKLMQGCSVHGMRRPHYYTRESMKRCVEKLLKARRRVRLEKNDVNNRVSAILEGIILED